MSSTFYWIDVGLYVAGGLCVVWGLRQAYCNSRPLPFAGLKPDRAFSVELLAVPIAVYFVFVLLVQLLMLPQPGEAAGNLRTLQAHANNLVQLAGLLACLWVGSVGPDRSVKGFLLGQWGLRRWVGTSLVSWLASLSLCALTLWVTELSLAHFAPGEPPNTHGTLQALDAESPGVLDLLSLYGGALLIAPLAEEFFFRGLVQNAVAGLTGNRIWAIAISAAAFGFIHVNQPQAIPALIVFGWVLGLAYEWSGSLMTPVAVHILFNLRTLVWHAVGVMPIGG